MQITFLYSAAAVGACAQVGHSPEVQHFTGCEPIETDSETELSTARERWFVVAENKPAGTRAQFGNLGLPRCLPSKLARHFHADAARARWWLGEAAQGGVQHRWQYGHPVARCGAVRCAGLKHYLLRRDVTHDDGQVMPG